MVSPRHFVLCLIYYKAFGLKGAAPHVVFLELYYCFADLGFDLSFCSVRHELSFSLTNIDLLAACWIAATAGCLMMRSTEIA